MKKGKIAALVLAIGMVFSAVGCGNAASRTSQEQQGQQQVPQQNATFDVATDLAGTKWTVDAGGEQIEYFFSDESYKLHDGTELDSFAGIAKTLILSGDVVADDNRSEQAWAYTDKCPILGYNSSANEQMVTSWSSCDLGTILAFGSMSYQGAPEYISVDDTFQMYAIQSATADDLVLSYLGRGDESVDSGTEVGIGILEYSDLFGEFTLQTDNHWDWDKFCDQVKMDGNTVTLHRVQE